jgi:hypothetical protein
MIGTVAFGEIDSFKPSVSYKWSLLLSGADTQAFVLPSGRIGTTSISGTRLGQTKTPLLIEQGFLNIKPRRVAAASVATAVDYLLRLALGLL